MFLPLPVAKLQVDTASSLVSTHCHGFSMATLLQVFFGRQKHHQMGPIQVNGTMLQPRVMQQAING